MTRWTILKKRLSGHVRPGPAGSPQWTPEHSLAQKIPFGFVQTRKVGFIPLVFAPSPNKLPNKYFPKQGKEAEKVWTQHLAFKSK